MTEPFYNSDLMPGFIADFSYVFDPNGEYHLGRGSVPTCLRELTWFCQNMRGVFILREQNTAHWHKHVVVSHPEDGVMTQMFLKDVLQWKESVVGWGDKQPQQKFATLEEWDEHWGIARLQYHDTVFYGRDKADALFIRDWLRKNPVPISPLGSFIDDAERVVSATNRMLPR